MRSYRLFGSHLQGDCQGISLCLTTPRENCPMLLFRLVDPTPIPHKTEEQILVPKHLRSVKVLWEPHPHFATATSMADARIYDGIHPHKPLFLRTYAASRPFTASLLPFPEKTFRFRTDLCAVGVWELSDLFLTKAEPVCAWFLPFGALRMEANGKTLSFGIGEGGFFLCLGTEKEARHLLQKELDAIKTHRRSLGSVPFFSEITQLFEAEKKGWEASFSSPCSQTTQALLQTLLSRIDGQGQIGDPFDCSSWNLHRQTYVLQQLSRVVLPNSPLQGVCHQLYAACFRADQPRKEVRDETVLPRTSAAYPAFLLALWEYESNFDPSAFSRHRSAYRALLEKTSALSKQGYLPGCEEDALPFAATFAPSLQRTLEWYVCRCRFASPEQQAFDMEAESSSLHDLAKVAPPPLPLRTVGYCDVCSCRLPSVLPQPLTLAWVQDRPYYVCAHCRKEGRRQAASLPPLPFETYGMISDFGALPKDASFAHRVRAARLRKSAHAKAFLNEAKDLGIDTLPTVTLTDLFLLSLQADGKQTL